MKFVRALASALTLQVVLVAAGCGSSNVTAPSSSTTNNTTTTTPTTGTGSTTFTLTTPPVALSRIQTITPLGNLNPPGHTFPTDHIYFFHHVGRESEAQYDVVAPADGTIVTIQHDADDAIYIAASSVHTYYLGHMLVASGIAQNQKVTAGQRLGTTSPVSHALDLGVLNSTVNNTFISPDRYGSNSRQAEAPYKYFGDALKAQLNPLIDTTADNREGQLNFDRSGTLSGNWFHETLGISESVGPSAGPRHLAFVRDPVTPTRRVISLGGTVGPAGIYILDASDPDPTSITPSSGAVTLHLSNTQQDTRSVPMIVTMTTGTRVRVQYQGADQFYVR